jgi:hypothetical protein
MNFIRNQTFQVNKIIFFFFKDDAKFYDLYIDDVEIILVDKNLKPHLKYFYAMNLYRDYAIITLDDDIGYAKDTFKSLYKAYLENPNVISGRRGHLMTYKNNGELRGYFEWKFQQKLINATTFNLTLTNVGGSIFPPDILNINEDFLPIINETITCDDLTLKHLANLKGIPHKWVFNTRLMGMKKIINPNTTSTLFEINHYYNDICINKLNIIINKNFLKNLCVTYRDIPTGKTIYLFDIHNQRIVNKIFYFDLFAYSYCPIDNRIKFTIYFDNYTSKCSINETKMVYSMKNCSIASCYMKEFLDNKVDLNSYYFPIVKNKENIIIKIYNYRKYQPYIFNDFICEKENNCTLNIISYEDFKFSEIPLIINKKQYLCNVIKNNMFLDNKFPKFLQLKCNGLKNLFKPYKYFISGIPNNVYIKDRINDNLIIPNQFVVSGIILDNDNITNQLISNGNLVENPKKDSYSFSINIIYPKLTLECVLKANSKFVQSVDTKKANTK